MENSKQSSSNKFNYKELMNHKPKTKIIVKELNEPNLDKMAKAIWDLLKK